MAQGSLYLTFLETRKKSNVGDLNKTFDLFLLNVNCLTPSKIDNVIVEYTDLNKSQFFLFNRNLSL